MTYAYAASTRRRMLAATGSAATLGLFSALLADRSARASQTVTSDRPYWRFCNKCQVLFYTDARDNLCAAGGKHVPQGYEFRIPFDGAETATAQRNWRTCKQCQAMFFNGYAQKGKCPVGGTHVADQTWRYVIPHSIGETARAQAHWRFCNKCFAMFFNGYSNKGSCAAGGVHVAQGYNFVLPHPR